MVLIWTVVVRGERSGLVWSDEIVVEGEEVSAMPMPIPMQFERGYIGDVMG